MPLCEVLAHFQARRHGAAKIFAAIVAASLFIAALLPPQFAASATLAVLPSPEFTVRQDAGSRALSSSAFDMDQVMKAETEILQSADLHEATLRALGVENVYPSLDPASAGFVARALRTVVRTLLSPWIATTPDSPASRMARALHQFDANLLVLPTKESNVIEVTFEHRDSIMAAQVVTTLLARYAQRREQLYNDPQFDIVRRETDRLASTVRDADAALTLFKAVHNFSDYGAERDLLLRRQSDTREAMSQAAVAGAEQQARVTALDRQIRITPPTVSLYQENDIDSRLQTIDAGVVDLRMQLAAARVHYRDGSRKVTDLLTQLNTRENDRERMARRPVASVVRAGRSPSLDTLLLDRAHAATERAAAVARVLALRVTTRDLDRRLGELRNDETALAELERRKNAADAAFASASQILAEQRMTEAEDALRLANVRIIQPARPPLHAAPIPLLLALAGAIFGALAAFLWCIAGILIRATLLTEEGLAHATGLPVLGVFPGHGTATRSYAPL